MSSLRHTPAPPRHPCRGRSARYADPSGRRAGLRSGRLVPSPLVLRVVTCGWRPPRASPRPSASRSARSAPGVPPAARRPPRLRHAACPDAQHVGRQRSVTPVAIADRPHLLLRPGLPGYRPPASRGPGRNKRAVIVASNGRAVALASHVPGVQARGVPSLRRPACRGGGTPGADRADREAERTRILRREERSHRARG